MLRSKKIRTSLNFQLIIILYTCFLLLVCSLAIYYSYHERKNIYINKFNNTVEQLEREYTNILENFWKIYMPIFEEQNTNYQVLYNYFSNDATLTPTEKKEIVTVLKQMALRDDRIQWLAIYRGEHSDNYILFSDSSTLVKMDETFPYWQHIKNKSAQMEVYDARLVDTGSYSVTTLAISGGIMRPLSEGAIIAGYDVSCFGQYCNSQVDDAIHCDYLIRNNYGTVFNTSTIKEYKAFTPQKDYDGIVKLPDNKSYFSKSITTTGRLSFTVAYFSAWWPLFVHSASTTLLIAVFFTIFSLVAFYLYITEIKSMSNKIKETSLAEIQAKFNPHFLYNYLESLREKIYSSGDYESAEALVNLSFIFRKLVTGENFVTIRDEIAFCDMYISLFQNYYGYDLDVEYDIDNDILNYGIIRNLLQPLVENYFVHGFNDQVNTNHFISIKGTMHKNQYILITYADNGPGMSPDKLDTLKQQLVSNTLTNSYGLKSIYQRVKLFYGDDCGIKISNNTPSGLLVQIKIKKLTLEEHNMLLRD